MKTKSSAVVQDVTSQHVQTLVQIQTTHNTIYKRVQNEDRQSRNVRSSNRMESTDLPDEQTEDSQSLPYETHHPLRLGVK